MDDKTGCGGAVTATSLERAAGVAQDSPVRHAEYETLIAAAIDVAVAAECERCARVATQAAEFNQSCPNECKCGDGWHIAALIRKGKP